MRAGAGGVWDAVATTALVVGAETVEAGILSIETCTVSLVIGGVLSKEAEEGVGTDAGLGCILIVAVTGEGGQRCGTVTREGGV